MSAAFFFWEEDNKDWVPIVGSRYENDPFSVLDTATGEITLATKARTYLPYEKIHVRVEYTANDVKNWFTERMVADEFDVILREDCSANELTLVSSRADSEQYVGESAITYTIDYTASVPDNACPITATLYILNPYDETWIEYDSAEWTTI